MGKDMVRANPCNVLIKKDKKRLQSHSSKNICQNEIAHNLRFWKYWDQKPRYPENRAPYFTKNICDILKAILPCESL